MGLLSGMARMGGGGQMGGANPQFEQSKEMLAQRIEQSNPQIAQMIRSAQDESQLAQIIQQLQGQGGQAGPQGGGMPMGGGMGGRPPGY